MKIDRATAVCQPLRVFTNCHGMIASADEQEARLNTLMVSRTGAPIVLTDADKFGRRLTCGVTRPSAGARMLTDARLGADWQGRLAEQGVMVTLVDAA